MSDAYKELIDVGVALSRAKDAGDEDAVAELSGWYDELNESYMASERERLDPSRDVNAFEAGVIGVGETFSNFMKGMQQWGNRITGDDESADRLAAEVAADEQAMATLKEKFPVATTVGNITPYLATAPLSGVSGAMLSAIPSAIEYGTGKEQATNTAVDVAIGSLPFGIGKAARAMSGADSRLADRAVELGYDLTPGEVMDSKALKQIEASMESNPFYGRGLAQKKANRQDIVNQVALDAVGDTTGAKNFAGSELDVAMATHGGASRGVIESHEYPIDDRFLENLIDAESKSKGGFFKDSGETGALVDRILDEGDAISGERMMELRSALGTEAARVARNPDAPAEYVKSLHKISRSVDDLIERNLSPEELMDWKEARSNYSAAKKIEKSKAIDAEGNVSGTKLYNSIRIQDPKGMGRNRNTSDLYDVARASQAYKPLADSQTATRAFIPYLASQAVQRPLSTLGSLLGGALIGSVYANPAGGITRTGQALTRGLLDYDEEDEE